MHPDPEWLGLYCLCASSLAAQKTDDPAVPALQRPSTLMTPSQTQYDLSYRPPCISGCRSCQSSVTASISHLFWGPFCWRMLHTTLYPCGWSGPSYMALFPVIKPQDRRASQVYPRYTRTIVPASATSIYSWPRTGFWNIFAHVMDHSWPQTIPSHPPESHQQALLHLTETR